MDELQGLSGADLAEYIRNCREDLQFFGERFLRVQTTHGELTPLKLNRPQKVLLYIFKKIKERRLLRCVILKGRRMGVSTLVSALFFQRTALYSNRYAMQVTQEPQASEFLFKMVKRFYDFMPEGFRPEVRANNARLMEFNTKEGKGLNSAFRVATAGKEDLGSSQLVHYFHSSETAKWPQSNIDNLLTAVLQTIPKWQETAVIFESTALGVGGEFHDRFWACKYRYFISRLSPSGNPIISESVNQAADPLNEYTAIFLPWFIFDTNRLTPPPGFAMTPEEVRLAERFGLAPDQVYWRRHTIANEMRGSEEKFQQEHPSCLTGEMRVSTDIGIIKISEAAKAKKTESGPIKRWGLQPKSSIWRLTTTYGRILRGTHDHPVQTTNGLVDLSRLSPGDRVVLRSPVFSPAAYEERWETDMGEKHSVAISPELGRWIGYFMGDGSWHKGTLDFALDAKDQDVVENVSLLTERFFGNAPSARTVAKVKGRKGYVNLRLGCLGAQGLMERLGLIGQNGSQRWRREVGVPECIWRSPGVVVKEFLRGLFECDGSARGGQVTWASSKHRFAQDVQLLLLGFGFNARLQSYQKISGSGAKYTTWTLGLNAHDSRRFHDEIGFVGARKRSLRTTGSRVGRPTWPRAMLDEVLRVELDGYEETFDFVMDTQDHLFMAQGILTHNTPEEAFLGTGRPVFDNNKIAAARDAAPPPIATYEFMGGHFVYHKDGRLKVWEEPRPGREYILAADVSEGLASGDANAAVVVDHLSGDQAAEWHGKCDPDEYARILHALGMRYGTALLAPERNNHGLTVVTILFSMHYPRLYHEMVPDPPGRPRKRYGWLTSSATRPLIIDNLVQEVREGAHGLKSKALFGEMLSFKIQENGAFEADHGRHDDLVIAAAIAKHLRGVIPLPSMREGANGLESQPMQSAMDRNWV